MSRKFDDEMLEKMLEQYFSRQTEESFKFDYERCKRSVKNDMKMNSFLKVAVACACIAIVSGVGIFAAARNLSGDLTDFGNESQSSSNDLTESGNESQSSSMNKEKRLFLSAYAADGGTGIISEVVENPDKNATVSLYNYGQEDYGGISFDNSFLYFLDDENKTFLNDENFDNYYDMIAYAENPDNYFITDGIPFSFNGYSIIPKMCPFIQTSSLIIDIQGEGILTYDVESENGGNFMVLIHNPDNNPDYDPHIQKDIPYGSDYEINWYPPREYDDKFLDFEPDYYSMDDHLKNAENALQTAEDYTYYFGDTINVTAHFEDGTTETSTIVVTLDENGKYLVEYK